MSSMLLAIAAARGARCNQTLSFFRQAGARLSPPRPPRLSPSLDQLPPSNWPLVPLRCLPHLSLQINPILSIYLASPLGALHNDPRPPAFLHPVYTIPSFALYLS